MSRLLLGASPAVLATINVSLSFGAYFALLRSPMWGTNDDPAMSMAAAGVWRAAEPTADLLFIHPWYGAVVSGLYRLVPQVPWYGLLFLAAVFVSLWTLGFSLLRLWKRLDLYLLTLAATLATAFPALWHLQFTLVAGLLTVAGVTLMVSALLRRPATARGEALLLGASLALVCLGVMVRVRSAHLVLALVVPCGALFVWKGLRDAGLVDAARPFLWRCGLLAAAVVTIVVGLPGIERAHYAGSEPWSAWFRLNGAKHAFLDYHRVEYSDATEQAFADAGWDRNDFDMVMTWQYVDPVRYAPERLERVAAAAATQPLAGTSYGDEVGGLASELLRSVRDYYAGRRRSRESLKIASALVACALFAFLLAVWRRPSNLPYVAAIAVTGGVVVFYLYAVLERHPFRVLALLWVTWLWWTLLVTVVAPAEAESAESMQPRSVSFYPVLVAAVAITMAFSLDLSAARARVRKGVARARKVDAMLGTWAEKLPADAVIYAIGSSFPTEAILPLDTFEACRKVPGLISAGTSNQSPNQRARARQLGLEGDFYAALARRAHVYTVARAKKKKREWELGALAAFYRKNHRLALSYEEVPGLPRLRRMAFEAIGDPPGQASGEP